MENLKKGSVTVQVYAIKDREHFMVYSPELGLYGYSDQDGEEAKNDFRNSVEFFLNYHSKKNTLVKELTRLGWQFIKDRPKAPAEVKVPANLLSLLSSSKRMDYRIPFPAL